MVVDTNVPLTANRNAGVSMKCIRACQSAIGRVMGDDTRLALDTEWRIIREYRRKLSPSGEPGIGDRFLKWVLTNWSNPARCELVQVTPRQDREGDFQEFPRGAGLETFDPADRKFVAVACAHVDNRRSSRPWTRNGGAGDTLSPKRESEWSSSVRRKCRRCTDRGSDGDGDRASGGAVVETFVKFSRTPHLVWLGEGRPRGDKLLEPRQAKALLQRPAIIEEKLDGANLGLSVDGNGRIRAQSRGHYLAFGTEGQWKPLWRWLTEHQEPLRELLGHTLILFGEWCYAEHSTPYDALPDWFLAFDVYDRTEGRFWSRDRRDRLAEAAGLHTVPFVVTGTFTVERLQRLMGRSRVGSSAAEGLYLRWDDDDWLVARAKVVRRGWMQATDEHWTVRGIRPNRLAASVITLAERRG